MSTSSGIGGFYAVIDASHCTDCRSCVIACKDENALNDWPPYAAAMPMTGQNWIHVENVERGHFLPLSGTAKVKFRSYPVLCMQCDNAPCMAAATGGAVYKRPDGIVIIDPVKAKGQQQIVNACPYGVISWNPDLQIPQKCSWCVQRLQKGLAPRCMNACPGLTIKIGQYQDTVDAATAGRIEFTTLHPEYKTQSRAYYVGLPKTFIAGSLVNSGNGECLAGATVTCTDTAPATPNVNPIVGSTTSDAYGDFWFDGLDAKKTYTVTISAAGKTTKTISVPLDTDTNLGDIQI